MDIVEQLGASFKGVSPADLRVIVNLMKRETYPAGTILFKKGDAGDSMYIIVSGRLRIYTYDAQGNELTLTQYGPARVFGDFSLLDQQPRSASAEAVDQLEVLMLRRDEFLKLLPQYPMLGLALIRNLADRVRHITYYLNTVNSFTQRLSAGEYEQAIKEIPVNNNDHEIQGLFKTYLEMVHSLQAREEQLKQAPAQQS